MEYCLDLNDVKAKEIKRLSDKFYGWDPINQRELSFTNYYMEINGNPFIGISGECHYSRIHEKQWEDTIRKMKMGGINIIATYIFWIHHEEEEGVFRFDGNRNVRKFLEYCKKYGMYVIVRIGPFDHGEVRNGGLPDWLYGKPFDVRGLNEGFLGCTRRLYRKLAEQFHGLYFQDGGPIIGAQIENEYMHSAAPWEITTGITNEWVPGGNEGEEYMRTLKRIAREEGICTPFYTCTGWGGAAAPVDEMLPLWGGYAFWPWIFYDYRGEHPATPEYIYRDYHNNERPKTYNFEPGYQPEDLPYCCCEMGGGMSCYYHYRFRFPYESVDAMANIKLAGGCNFLGYYMYRGGSNPRGERTLFLNECQCPKISYDYQAVIGEYGQLRPGYYRLKALHLFVRNFQQQLCGLPTALPKEAGEIQPEDVETLRYAVRSDGERGFLFLNNYQDHVACRKKENETIVLKKAGRDIRIEGISLAPGEEAILPFRMDVEGYCLLYAKAQPLSVIREGGHKVYFFFVPEGMDGEYVWEGKGLTSVNGKPLAGEREVVVSPTPGKESSYKLCGSHGEVEIVTLTREESLHFYEIHDALGKTAVLCDAPFSYDDGKIYVESPDNKKTDCELFLYPKGRQIETQEDTDCEKVSEGMWEGIRFSWEKQPELSVLKPKRCGQGRYTVVLPDNLDGCKEALLQIFYDGDVGHLFINGIMVSDNFSNGAVWEVGLREVWKPEMGKELTILITPRKKDAAVNVSSTMAGRLEQLAGAVERLEKVQIRRVTERVFQLQ